MMMNEDAKVGEINKMTISFKRNLIYEADYSMKGNKSMDFSDRFRP